jgi:protein-S-isoprenylcysteine O-methyltransferase Ste14
MTDLIIFLITLAAEALTTIAVIISIAAPHRRIWPPIQQRSFSQSCKLILFSVSTWGSILLGIVDWGNFIIPSWARIGIGLPVWLAGDLLTIWALATLGIAPTSGNQGSLVQHGPYRFSRNPQYVGFMIGLIGWVLMTDSTLTFIVSLVAIIPLALVPFAEEPWLCTRYGSKYEKYMRVVPRFIFF